MAWILEIPKFKYGYGYSSDRVLYRFSSKEEALKAQDKLQASGSQIYEVSD